MKAIISYEQSKTLDAAARRLLSLEPLQLMEKASLRIWDALRADIEKRPELAEKGEALAITAVCGKGDNGGDALAVLRHAFSSGYGSVSAIVSAKELGESAARQAGSLETAGISPIRWEESDEARMLSCMAGADIILDGILGTGLRGAADGETKAMIDCLNKTKSLEKSPFIVAIDLPSGLGDDWDGRSPCVAADLTLCLDPVKAPCYLPQARHFCGELIAVRDVFPESLIREQRGAVLLEDADLAGFLDPVEAEGYKMSRGRLAVFAGSLGATGAAQLCAKAALAAGAGYVSLHVDEAVYPIVAPTLESVIVKVWKGETDVGDCDAILAGPGWGRGEGRADLLRSLVESGIPLILDADGIRLLAANPEIARRIKAPCAVTPHPGEFSALSDAAGLPKEAPALQVMEQVSEAFGVLIMLKSHITWVVSPEGRCAVWEGMAPELGTAGSGDVLAGLFAGLAARKGAISRRKSGAGQPAAAWSALEESACSAVIAHGLAGKKLARSMGWFESSELVAECSRILHECDQTRLNKETPWRSAR